MTSGCHQYSAIAFCLTLGAGLMTGQSMPASALGRYLLVASEGLYVVEANGRPSWSYHPAPYGQQVKAMEDDIIYDGFALPGDAPFRYYIREIDRESGPSAYPVAAPVEVKVECRGSRCSTSQERTRPPYGENLPSRSPCLQKGFATFTPPRRASRRARAGERVVGWHQLDKSSIRSGPGSPVRGSAWQMAPRSRREGSA